jgi:hypothetical protein
MSAGHGGRAWLLLSLVQRNLIEETSRPRS